MYDVSCYGVFMGETNNSQKILPNTSRTYWDSNWVGYIWKYTQERIKIVM